MTPTKQTVYLPVSEFNSSERAICTIGIPDLYGDKVVEKEGYFFTPEQLNEYTANVIKEDLETAAKTRKNGFYDSTEEEQLILNTFEETYKKFKV